MRNRISCKFAPLVVRSFLVTAGILLIHTTPLDAQQLNREWVQRVTGGFAQAIAADQNDNSYAAGYVCTPGTCQNQSPVTVLQVVKYDKSGNADWTAQLANNPGNSQGTSIAVDAAGNVYVTGVVNYNNGTAFLEEWVTVKFSSAGQQLWSSYFTTTGGNLGSTPRIVVDRSGNSYIADGNGSTPLSPITTIKYDPDGFQLWIATLGSGTNDTGYSFHGFLGGLKLDGQGNLYVAASFDRADGFITPAITTLGKYDPNGNLLWSKNIAHSEPAVLALDTQGNAYVASDVGPATLSNSPSFQQVAKFDPNGNILWTGQYTPPVIVTAISVDGAGNAYTTGFLDATTGTAVSSSFSTVKFDANGKFGWEKTYNGNGNGFDQPNQLVVDPQNNSYVTGYSTRPGGVSGDNNDYTTIEYDSEGNQISVSKYSNAGDFGDIPAGIALGNAGIFVTGTAYAKYDNVAQSQWATIEYMRPSVINVSTSSLTFSAEVGISSASQQISVTNNGNSTIAITADPSIGGSSPAFSIANGTNCISGTAINKGSSCSIYVAFTPVAATQYNATLTIEDNDSSGPQVVTLTGTGSPALAPNPTPTPGPTPNFALTAATSSTAIVAGQNATYNVQIVPTSFSGPVTLACSGAPGGATCSVSPSSFTLTGNNAVAVVVTVATMARSAAAPAGIHFNARPTLWISILSMGLLSLLGFSNSSSRLRPTLGLTIVLLTACVGCSMATNGSSENRSTPPGLSTPAGTSRLTVTATAGATVRTLSLTLTVN